MDRPRPRDAATWPALCCLASVVRRLSSWSVRWRTPPVYTDLRSPILGDLQCQLVDERPPLRTALSGPQPASGLTATLRPWVRRLPRRAPILLYSTCAVRLTMSKGFGANAMQTSAAAWLFSQSHEASRGLRSSTALLDTARILNGSLGHWRYLLRSTRHRGRFPVKHARKISAREVASFPSMTPIDHRRSQEKTASHELTAARSGRKSSALREATGEVSRHGMACPVLTPSLSVSPCRCHDLHVVLRHSRTNPGLVQAPTLSFFSHRSTPVQVLRLVVYDLAVAAWSETRSSAKSWIAAGVRSVRPSVRSQLVPRQPSSYRFTRPSGGRSCLRAI